MDVEMVGTWTPPFFAKDLVQIIIIQIDSQKFSLVDGASTRGKATGKQNNAVRVACPLGVGGSGSHGRVHGDCTWFP